MAGRGNPARGVTSQVRDVTQAAREKIENNDATLGGEHIRDDTEIGTEFPRDAWIMAPQSWLNEENPRMLAFRCNPKDVAWRVPQRSSEQKTRWGTILHVWRDPVRGTYFDEPQLSFTFQAGNIMPIHVGTDLDSSTRPKVPPGLANFYMFLDMIDEQKVISSDDGFGDTNFIYIFYNSLVFPQITLAGLFSPEGTSWTESADNPVDHEWSATFTVYHSYPNLRAQELMKAFRDAGFGRLPPRPNDNGLNLTRDVFDQIPTTGEED